MIETDVICDREKQEAYFLEQAKPLIEAQIQAGKFSSSIIKMVWAETNGEVGGVEEVAKRSGLSVDQKRALRMRQAVAWRAVRNLTQDSALQEVCMGLSKIYEAWACEGEPCGPERASGNRA